MGHNGFKDGEETDDELSCILSNNASRFGDNLIKLHISLTNDKASLMTLHCFAHSCIQRLTECAVQWTYNAFGSSCCILVATPLSQPDMLAAPL